MGIFFKALKAGVAGFAEGMNEADQPRNYSIAGRPVTCPHCECNTFIPGRALLNTPVRSFFNIDFADPSATILVCAECGRIEWFAQAPDVVPDVAPDSRIDLSRIPDLD